MSGHSKWNNIKNKKEKTDAQKAKVFTKIGKEIAVAVRAGGPDPNVNRKLKDLIAKAKSLNVPNDNIERSIKKASGADGVSYEEITYEGYGPSGIALIVETTTDNRNRTASDVRHFFDKYGGNMGQSGCVSYMFDEKGVIVIEDEDEEYDEDEMMMEALEAGASDYNKDDDVHVIYTEPDDFNAVSEALQEKYTFASAQIEMVPQNYQTLEKEDDIKNMQKMLDAMEDDDDVQNVYHNWEQ